MLHTLRRTLTVLLFAAGSFAARATPDTAYFRPAMAEALDRVDAGRAGASAVVSLEEWSWLANEAGLDAEGARRLEQLAAPPTHPLVAAWIRARLADRALEAGDTAAAAAWLSGLGRVTDFQLAGPYLDDNAARFHEDEGVENLSRGFAPGKWRPVSIPSFRPVAVLTPFLYPDEQVSVYLAFFVQSPASQDAALRIGFGGSVRATVNGRAVGAFEGERRFAQDQSALPLPLRKGWNAVLLKLHIRDHGGALTVRLTDLQGAPLSLTTAAVAPRSFPWKADTRALQPPVTLPMLVPAGGLEEALLHRVCSDLDKSDTRPRDRLDSALREAPSDARLLLWRAHMEDDPSRFMQYAFRAFETGASPLAELYYRRFEGARGVDLSHALGVRSLRERYPGDVVFLTEEAMALTQFLTREQALMRLEELHRARPEEPAPLRGLMDALDDGTHPARLREVAREILAQDHTHAGVRTYLARQEWLEGHLDEALQLLAEGIALDPQSGSLVRTAADWLSGVGRYEEAAARWDDLLAACPNHFEALREKGYCLIGSGKRDEGVALLRKSLEALPQQVVLSRFLEDLEPAVPRPGQRALWGAAGPGDAVPRSGSENAVIHFDHEIIEVFPSGLTVRTFEFAAEVFDPLGVKQYRSIPVGYDPLRETFNALRMEIHRPDGTVIPGRMEFGGDTDDTENNLYYDYVVTNIVFPDLKPGDRIYARWELRDTEQRNAYGEYFGDLEVFSAPHRTLRKGLEVWMPSGRKLHHRAVRMDLPVRVSEEDGFTRYRWEAGPLQARPREASMPGAGDVESYLHVSTFADWKELGRWYQSFIRTQIELGSAETARIRSLTAGITDVREKVRIIHDEVVKKTRYVGLEFGVHGYKPYTCQQVLHRGFGDCKDKANLMVAMLEAAGVDAEMVLLRTRHLGSIETEPASLSVFNHAIAHVPALDLYLDGTAEWSGTRELPWQDQGATVLLVPRTGEPRLAKIPVDGAASNAAEWKYDVTLAADGTASGRHRVDVQGAGAAGMRRAFQSADKNAENTTRLIARIFPGAQAEAVTTSDVQDLDTPFHLESSVTLPGFASRDGRSLRIPISHHPPRLGNTYATLQSRSFPLEWGYPETRTEIVRIQLPEGVAGPLPQPAHLDSRFGKLDLEVTLSGSLLSITIRVEQKVELVGTADYADFRSWCTAVDRALEGYVVFTPDAKGETP